MRISYDILDRPGSGSKSKSDALPRRRWLVRTAPRPAVFYSSENSACIDQGKAVHCHFDIESQDTGCCSYGFKGSISLHRALYSEGSFCACRFYLFHYYLSGKAMDVDITVASKCLVAGFCHSQSKFLLCHRAYLFHYAGHNISRKVNLVNNVHVSMCL